MSTSIAEAKNVHHTDWTWASSFRPSLEDRIHMCLPSSKPSVAWYLPFQPVFDLRLLGSYRTAYAISSIAEWFCSDPPGFWTASAR